MLPIKKKVVKKSPRKEIPCPHCGQIFDFPAIYCPICKSHGHIAISGPSPDGCHGCRSGLTTHGQAYMRANRTWNGVKGIPGEYDRPEFYDGLLEICNMTLMPIWITYESGNAH